MAPATIRERVGVEPAPTTAASTTRPIPAPATGAARPRRPCSGMRTDAARRRWLRKSGSRPPRASGPT